MLAKHGNAAFNGLSGAAIVFLYATFAQKSDIERHEDKAAVTHSKLWQKAMDNEVEITLLKRRFSGLPESTEPASGLSQSGHDVGPTNALLPELPVDLDSKLVDSIR